MRKLQQILAIVVALVLTDAHWAVLQSVAWVEMVSVATAEEKVGFPDAIRDIIAGEEPCEKCCFIQKERESDREQWLETFAKSGSVAPLDRSRALLPPRERKNATFHPVIVHFYDTKGSDIDHPPQV